MQICTECLYESINDRPRVRRQTRHRVNEEHVIVLNPLDSR